jgi:lysine 2,3-aminomutase
MAVTLPSRFTDPLLRVFNQDWGFNLSLVSHFNHPKELTEMARHRLKKLSRAGVTLLNQSVLMRGINDSLPTLQFLFQTLYETGVIPYYLHHPDWTPGTFHFRLPIHQGQRLIQELRGRVSGPALPDYVLDIPRGLGKISLLNSSLKKVDEFRSDQGDRQTYGAIYEVVPPSTRNALQLTPCDPSSSKPLYLDFSSLSFLDGF